MKIFRLSQQQMVPMNQSGTSQENIGIQIQNLQQAIPTLAKFNEIISTANDIHAKAAEIGNELGEPGLADKLLEGIQAIIMKNPEFNNLVKMGIVGSVQELFNTGIMSQKTTLVNTQLQQAQQSQAQQSQQVQIGKM